MFLRNFGIHLQDYTVSQLTIDMEVLLNDLHSVILRYPRALTSYLTDGEISCLYGIWGSDIAVGKASHLDAVLRQSDTIHVIVKADV
jgi:hypothetical protein